MNILPVIAAIGGINPAGRTSSHHAYKRMIHEVLDENTMSSTWQDLARLMNLPADNMTQELIEKLKQGTLIRRVEEQHFNPDAVYYQRAAGLKQLDSERVEFVLKKKHLPEQVPAHWLITDINEKEVSITVEGQLDALLPGSYKMEVSSAGQLPTGFDPTRYYHSKFHPRGLAMTVFGVSDALYSLGIEWSELLNHIHPDQVSVYSGGAFVQGDENGAGGLFQNPLTGNRISSKMMPLSLTDMSADFINSYMINSVGNTGTNVGACATYLYNLRQGINDIQSGQARVAIIGSAEAPVIPEIMEGFSIMGALSKDKELCKLDNSEQPDNRRACRPFSSNAGFTMAESAQFMILMDDALAVELGVNILGSVPGVFVNADANKKSISGPGVGNYITLSKATALAKRLLGDKDLHRTFVQAHGTGTPQNRVTESHIMDQVADTFGITDWAVAAVKSYVGHSLGPAAADQIMSGLGVWAYGYVPGIRTIDHIADDVHQNNLNILMDHHAVGEYGEDMLGCMINSKGFGGNNASALILSPAKTKELLTARHGKTALTGWQQKNETVQEACQAYETKALKDEAGVVYEFGTSVMGENDVTLSDEQISLSLFKNSINLDFSNSFNDFLPK